MLGPEFAISSVPMSGWSAGLGHVSMLCFVVKRYIISMLLVTVISSDEQGIEVPSSHSSLIQMQKEKEMSILPLSRLHVVASRNIFYKFNIVFRNMDDDQ